MLLRKNRTLPSAIAAFTPPVCRLRAATCHWPPLPPVFRSRRQNIGSPAENAPALPVAGQPLLTSVPGEFGGNAPVKLLPPIIGQSITPRMSAFNPPGEVDDVRPSGLWLASTSLNATVFDDPSVICTSF